MAFNFKQKVADFQKLKRTLPAQVGNIAKRHFVDSFRQQGFTDNTLDPWKARKTKDKSDRRNQSSRAILVKTGHLRGSIRVKTATFNKTEIGSYGVPYAEFHNDPKKGGIKRQFIGRSNVLNRKIKARIDAEIKSIM